MCFVWRDTLSYKFECPPPKPGKLLNAIRWYLTRSKSHEHITLDAYLRFKICDFVSDIILSWVLRDSPAPLHKV